MNSADFEVQRLLLIPFDHLNRQRGVLAAADPRRDQVVMVESQRMLTGRPWHKERLFFLVSSARHFAADLRSEGFKVHYVKAESTVAGLAQVRSETGLQEVWCAEPSSFRMTEQLAAAGVRFAPNDFFLTSRTRFAEWAGAQKSYVMENFYREQRKRLNVLVPDGKPVGGRWNYDSENRLPPPKGYSWPPYLEHQRDELDLAVAAELGHVPTRTWATTRAGALRQLDYFVEHHLAGFGPYEDAIARGNWSLHHSLIAPYLNNGLLHAREAVAAVLTAFQSGAAPIESVEAFVRQVIGWREYINGMYWFLGEDYRQLNGLNAREPLPPVFSDSGRTEMNCVRSVVADVEERAWTHHIPRLMVLSNLALLSGVNPQEFLDWMREQFIDAADWVMVPNVIGMGVHADGGRLMTKPYAAGGAYLSRMSEFCGSCSFNPRLRTGDAACPFTTLYWDFLDRHQGEFEGNHRMFQQLSGLRRLSDLPEVRVRAAEVKDRLGRGEL